MRIIRSASSRAISGSVSARGWPGAFTANFGPNALPSLRIDSINRNVVGNQIGPRQLELPPLSFESLSAGS